MRQRKTGKTLRACFYCLAIAATNQVFAEQQPPKRTGLWVTQKISESAANPAGFEAAIRGNPHLAGVCLTVGWKEIETEPGKLDFSSIDKTVAVLHRIGMKYELALKPGIDTPVYVFRQGGKSLQTSITNPHRPNFGETVSVPVPWDPIYQRNFSRVIGQLGERYAADPLCVGVVLTCANFMSKEMHLPKTPEDRAKWSAMGDYGTKLLDVYKKYTDEWAKAFPNQQVTLHLSQVLHLPSSFFERIIDYGVSKYPERFTIQNCQLTGRREDAGILSYNLIQQFQDRAHHGFQSVTGFSHGGERMGSIEMAVLNVVHAKGEYWELDRGDGINPQTTAAIGSAWEEASKLGYNAYKEKLIAEGRYQEQNRGHRGRGGRGQIGRASCRERVGV